MDLRMLVAKELLEFRQTLLLEAPKMGDYTGLRFAAKLRPEMIPLIELLNQDTDDPPWERVFERYPHPELELWRQVPRCSFIPRGMVASYLPEEWQQQSEEGHSMLHEGEWKVVCSLKNHQKVIEIFMELVLPILISEPCCCEVLFEMADAPTLTVVQPRTPSIDGSADMWRYRQLVQRCLG